VETLTERVKILEDKVLKLEGANPLKVETGNPYKALEDSEEPTGNRKMISRPNNV
jgi:hypothetical protein